MVSFLLWQLSCIDPPQIPLAMVRYPDRSKAITNSICLGIISILVDYIVSHRINTRDRRSAHGDPDQSAAKGNLSACAGDMRRDCGLNLIGLQINSSDAAVRLAQHP